MKKYCTLWAILFLTITDTHAQSNFYDSLIRKQNKTSSDQARFGIYNELGDFFSPFIKTDSAMLFYKKADEIASRNNQRLLHALCVTKIALCGMFTQNAINNSNLIQQGLTLIKDPNTVDGKYWGYNKIAPDTLKLVVAGWLNWTLAHLHKDKLNNLNEAISYFKEGKRLALEAKDTLLWGFCNGSIMSAFLKENMPDSALAQGLALEQNVNYSTARNIFSYVRVRPETYPFYIKDIGNAHLELNNKLDFRHYLWKSIHFAKKQGSTGALFSCYTSITEFYLSENNKDSAFYYAKRAQAYFPTALSVNENLYKYYDLINEPDSVVKYMQLTLSREKEIRQSQLENNKVIQKASFERELQLQDLEKEKIENEAKWKTFSIAALILVFSIIGFLLYRNNRRERKARLIIEQSYSQLKSTQAQLIQSEKMASLGELTAGIAHEIQNPLNFVNNFSEVSAELVDELNDELNKGDVEEAKAIGEDLRQNLEKINHHGKRAEAIVRGMLQHSRKSDGTKEPTDINALCDEALRLAYHGLRAKDKSFNAELITDFDSSIGNINIIPQDISRVLLNIINNAFQAVDEKKQGNDEGFLPTVSVTTKRITDGIEITIADNGNGIPDNIRDKIFQPFFTTKPTGSGTGLGLSLAYDIVKAHGGELSVQSNTSQGASFIIQLHTNT